MKKSLFLALALAAICIIPSCKKFASNIAFGDTGGMRVATYDSTDMQTGYMKSFYDIDLNKDGQPDLQLLSVYEGSPEVGRAEVSYIKCLNENFALLGDIIIQEQYIHTDTTINQVEEVTYVTIHRTHSCERTDETDIVENTEEKLLLIASNAGKTFGLEDSFMSTKVQLNGFSYSIGFDPDGWGTNLVTRHYDTYNSNCDDIFPLDQEQYIGFKFNLNGRNHLGWMKIILEEHQGDYYVRPIESAIQK